MAREDIHQKFETLIATCDSLIKAGKFTAVSHELSAFSVPQVPRAYRHRLAKICRRAGLVTHGLRLLQPLVRHASHEEPATILEVCEYAILLSRNGSVQEALALLEKEEYLQNPEVWTSLAYCHMAMWEYSRVPSLLEKYLASDADPYSKLIARLNLASAYLGTSHFEKAERFSTETITLARQAGALRVVANGLEVRGQVHFRQGDFGKARLDLSAASSVLTQNQTDDQLFIHKWQAIMDALEKKSKEPLVQFRSEAVRRKHWESVREADLFLLKLSFDQNLLNHLVHGTRWLAYRERIQEIIGVSASDTYIFGQNCSRILDLSSGSSDDNSGLEFDLNSGKKIHQTVSALLRDFYVPSNIGSLFGDLYPEEYFNINSSPLRVRQLLSRVRRWIEDNRLPLSLEQENGHYRLLVRGDLGIRVGLQKPAFQSQALHKKWLQLKKQFPASTTFTAHQACDSLGWSRAHFRLVIQQALSSGELTKSGAGKNITYQIQSLANLNEKPTG